jgi:hypothetical protein
LTHHCRRYTGCFQYLFVPNIRSRALREKLPRLLMLLILALPGCEAKIQTIVAKPGYFSDPHRIFVVDSIDPRWGSCVSATFRTGMREGLARCGISVAEFKTDPLALNSARRVKDEIATFQPDLLFRIETRAVNIVQYTDVMRYWVGAWDPRRDATHEVWSAEIRTMDFTGAEDREHRGKELADKIIRKMTEDGMLPSCAAPFGIQGTKGAPA